MGQGIPPALRLLGALLLGALIGWSLRGESARAAGEWHVSPTTAPGWLFFRYNTAGDVQGCASVSGVDFECRMLKLAER
jgi:hypothetical protein